MANSLLTASRDLKLSSMLNQAKALPSGSISAKLLNLNLFHFYVTLTKLVIIDAFGTLLACPLRGEEEV